MAIHYDDKGKFFTEIISKDPRTVLIQTLTHRIRGTLYVRRGERLIDELRSGEKFLAMTEVTLYDAKGAVMLQTDFMSINRDQIIWILPEDEVQTEKPTTGDHA
jgi:hypothetical protein